MRRTPLLLRETPPWWKGDAQTGKGPIGHAYYNNAIDPTRGVFYLHQPATGSPLNGKFRPHTAHPPGEAPASHTLEERREVRVHDSTADMRYLVLPMRPAGTEGWSEEKLAELVTRDSMIGTGVPKSPKDIAK